jgi:DNA polymerase/3'-5' exonuclease PolX
MYNREEALSVAEAFILEIKDFCKRDPEVVGSILRKKKEVHDIDIIVISKTEKTPDDSLFGEPVEFNLLDRKLAEMCNDGELKLESGGPKIKRFYGFCGSPIPIDVYICNEKTWATTKLIRTGSKEHNIMLAKRALELHMQLKADGSGLISPGGKLIEINDEKEVFDKLSLMYVTPEER